MENKLNTHKQFNDDSKGIRPDAGQALINKCQSFSMFEQKFCVLLSEIGTMICASHLSLPFRCHLNLLDQNRSD